MEIQGRNATGTEILNNQDLIKSQYNLITFNGRYSQMTYEAITLVNWEPYLIYH
jgi:iron complex outermembrane receptor protein